MRTRTAVKRALRFPFVPVRQVIIYHLASASMFPAATDRTSGIGRGRGRPHLATGKIGCTPAG